MKDKVTQHTSDAPLAPLSMHPWINSPILDLLLKVSASEVTNTQAHGKSVAPFRLRTCTGGEDKVVLKEFEAVLPNLNKEGMTGDVKWLKNARVTFSILN